MAKRSQFLARRYGIATDGVFPFQIAEHCSLSPGVGCQRRNIS
jgi:hypothetical protein